MDDMIVNLEYPITKGEVTVDKLVFTGRPKVRHMIAGDKYPRGSYEYECAIMAAMTGVPEIVIREMDYEDFIHADAVMGQRFNTFYEVQRALTESDPSKAPQE
ncbi:phage tail assembly protein [Treponema vincentii]|uniref:phage tail assembly protein n=1 Tax=Treponema vincentii TaxID=69710 RepID=UPI0020A33F28|nr:phage tail assembly protein [Treponema vincentii]UTC47446.1 phage tail assembly protein [Treponema vincentii]UTC48356.1 phage tail assembly protein [Treponema vincentii]